MKISFPSPISSIISSPIAISLYWKRCLTIKNDIKQLFCDHTECVYMRIYVGPTFWTNSIDSMNRQNRSLKCHFEFACELNNIQKEICLHTQVHRQFRRVQCKKIYSFVCSPNILFFIYPQLNMPISLSLSLSLIRFVGVSTHTCNSNLALIPTHSVSGYIALSECKREKARE